MLKDGPKLKGVVIADDEPNIEGVVFANRDCEVFAWKGEPVDCPNKVVPADGNRLGVVPKAPVEFEILENGFTGAG